MGGITRLTESGLSITEWRPVSGVLPPLNEADWVAEFEKYKQIPEYKEINRGMSLDEFKAIFFWEWLHRILGRGQSYGQLHCGRVLHLQHRTKGLLVELDRRREIAASHCGVGQLLELPPLPPASALSRRE